jgi:hypothetical protein
LRKLVLGIPAQASGKNLTRPPMPNLAFKTHEIIDHIIYYLRNAAVKIESIDVAETIKTTKALIETEASLGIPATDRRIKNHHCS